MALLDLLGRRWNLRILWELRDGGGARFRALQTRCDGMSPSVLSTRLRELRELGLVELRKEDGYRLTADGRSLLVLLEPVRNWTNRWAAHLAGRGGPLT